ncbi:MAG: GNAT family N-acetyltransferase [Tissierella sp.]|uniref:GNAT family N-acetyltransferase n=1 Tax=Tissierella sp. TaxID=41274 RepID=UPI003F990C86
MNYRTATLKDIPAVQALQEKYHVSTISEEDKPDGFVTTLFTEEQFKKLIEKEDGLFLATDDGKVIAYAMAASWDYWSAWALFEHMIKDLPSTTYLGQTLSTENSYQYGPIAIEKKYRGTKVLPNLFEFSRKEMQKRFPILITFINQINPRSLKAHTNLELDIIKEFQFNNNDYYELGYDTSKKTKGSTI